MRLLTGIEFITPHSFYVIVPLFGVIPPGQLHLHHPSSPQIYCGRLLHICHRRHQLLLIVRKPKNFQNPIAHHRMVVGEASDKEDRYEKQEKGSNQSGNDLFNRNTKYVGQYWTWNLVKGCSFTGVGLNYLPTVSGQFVTQDEGHIR